MSRYGVLWSLRKRTWIGLMLVVLLMGAAFQVAFAAAPSTQPVPPIRIRFPRVVLTLDESGTVTDVGVMISEDTQLRLAEPQLAFFSSILGVNLTTPMFDAAIMGALSDANIQHVELQTGDKGIALHANSQFLLGVEWEDLARLSEVARLGELANIPFAAQVAQLVPAIGADVLILLPTPAGVEPIAPRPISPEVEFPAREAPPGEPPLVVHASGEYAADGTAVMLGKPLADWGRLFGANLSMLNLDPRAITVFQNAGIETIGMTIDSAGASLLVDSDRIATVVLGDEQSLEIAMRLAERFQVPFAEFIPLAGMTKDLDIRVNVALPSAK